MGASFIDSIGASLIFPFLSLYLTSKFGVGLTEVGILFGLYSIATIFGNIIGGALADRIGRKGVVIFGLIVSATTSISLALAPSFDLLYLLVVFVGLFATIGGPARQAMVADLLPEEKRAEGYGIHRVVFNLSYVIGPIIGGFLASRSYLSLFIMDALLSLVVAAIVLFALPETAPVKTAAEEGESVTQTFKGYSELLKDGVFVVFALGFTMLTFVYMQLNSTLPVFLRDVHSVSTRTYGIMLSVNAAMVVLFQFAITRKTSRYPPMLVMVAGTLLYALGFGLFGFVSAIAGFFLAVVIVTIGEMLVAPVAQAIVADLAPEDMRGRYMAGFNLSHMIAIMSGPLLAGYIIDNLDPRNLWLITGIAGVLAASMFFFLYRRGRGTVKTVERATQAAD